MPNSSPRTATMSCAVAGREVTQYHLRESCKICFGNVECAYDPAAAGDPDSILSPVQMEHDLRFLRSENAELRDRIRALERRIDILGSAQLFSERRSQKPENGEQALEHLAAVEAELEQTREELAIALRARDAARTAAGMLHSEKTSILREIRSSGAHRLPAPIQ